MNILKRVPYSAQCSKMNTRCSQAYIFKTDRKCKAAEINKVAPNFGKPMKTAIFADLTTCDQLP